MVHGALCPAAKQQANRFAPFHSRPLPLAGRPIESDLGGPPARLPVSSRASSPLWARVHWRPLASRTSGRERRKWPLIWPAVQYIITCCCVSRTCGRLAAAVSLPAGQKHGRLRTARFPALCSLRSLRSHSAELSARHAEHTAQSTGEKRAKSARHRAGSRRTAKVRPTVSRTLHALYRHCSHFSLAQCKSMGKKCSSQKAVHQPLLILRPIAFPWPYTSAQLR